MAKYGLLILGILFLSNIYRVQASAPASDLGFGPFLSDVIRSQLGIAKLSKKEATEHHKYLGKTLNLADCSVSFEFVNSSHENEASPVSLRLVRAEVANDKERPVFDLTENSPSAIFRSLQVTPLKTTVTITKRHAPGDGFLAFAKAQDMELTIERGEDGTITGIKLKENWVNVVGFTTEYKEVHCGLLSQAR